MKIVDTRKVYLIWNPETNKVKIGVSVNPVKRRDSLIHACGCMLEIKYTTPLIEDFFDLERKMHELFKESRSYGEWFSIHYSKPMKALISLEDNYPRCKVFTLFKSGLNPTKIASKLNVSRTAIVKNLKARGIKIKSGRKYTKSSLDYYSVLERAPSKEEFLSQTKKRDIPKPKTYIDISPDKKVTNLDIAAMVMKNNEKLRRKKERRTTSRIK